MSRDFGFVQTAPGRVFVGWGPFEQLPFRRPGRPAFFVTDFFLDDPHPWRHPAEWEEVSVEELASRFEAGDLPEIEWEPPSRDDFARLFDSAQESFARGDFTKIVPVLFETGRFGRDDTAVVAGLLAAYGVGLLAQAATKLLASGFYGLRDTRTPVRIAIATLIGGTALGYWFLTRTGFGVAGIALGSALGAWAYAVLAVAGLDRRLGAPVIGPGERAVLVRVALATALAAGAGLLALRLAAALPLLARAALAWATFGAAYLGAGAALGLAEARGILRRAGFARR